MFFKSVTGTNYELDVNVELTFGEVAKLINKKYNSNNNISFVYSGRSMKHDQTVESQNLSNDDTIFIVSRPKQKPDIKIKVKKEPDPKPVPDSETKGNPETKDNPENYEYIVEYTGDEVKKAMLRDSRIMLNIIHIIGKHNPFFLSYLATNPQLALNHIKETLEQPDFKFIFKGANEEEDPIKQFLNEVSDSDENNINYIIDQCSNLTSDMRTQVKDLYLLHHKDIQKTLTVSKTL